MYEYEHHNGQRQAIQTLVQALVLKRKIIFQVRDLQSYCTGAGCQHLLINIFVKLNIPRLEKFFLLPRLSNKLLSCQTKLFRDLQKQQNKLLAHKYDSQIAWSGQNDWNSYFLPVFARLSCCLFHLHGLFPGLLSSL